MQAAKTIQRTSGKKRCRTGCLTCRRRGYKCDEAKPDCYECRRLGFKCEGYQLRLLWKDDAEKRGIAHGRAGLRYKRKEDHLNQGSIPLSHTATTLATPCEAISPSSERCITIPTSPTGLPDVSDEEKSLLHHWVMHTSTVLSTCTEAHQQFLNVMTPMALGDKSLWKSLMAVVSSHLNMQTQQGAKALQWRQSAISSLRLSLTDPVVLNSDSTLATILLLRMMEVSTRNPSVSASGLTCGRISQSHRIIEQQSTISKVPQASSELGAGSRSCVKQGPQTFC